MATQADSDSDTQVSTSALLSSVYQASRERLFVRMLWTKQLLLPKWTSKYGAQTRPIAVTFEGCVFRAQVKAYLSRPESIAFPKNALMQVYDVMHAAVHSMKSGECSFECISDIRVDDCDLNRLSDSDPGVYWHGSI